MGKVGSYISPTDQQPYRVRGSNEWFHVAKAGHLMACCDCGLVHLVKIRKRKDGKIMMRAERRSGETRSMRRSMGGRSR